MSTPKPGLVVRGPALPGQNKTVGRAPKTTFEASLAAAADKLRHPETNAAETAAMDEIKKSLAQTVVRSLLTTQKPAQIDREQAITPEDDE